MPLRLQKPCRPEITERIPHVFPAVSDQGPHVAWQEKWSLGRLERKCAELALTIQLRAKCALRQAQPWPLDQEVLAGSPKGDTPPPYSPGASSQLAGSVHGLERLDKPAFGNACECQAERLCRSGTIRAGSTCSAPPLRGCFDNQRQSSILLYRINFTVKFQDTKVLFSFRTPVPSGPNWQSNFLLSPDAQNSQPSLTQGVRLLEDFQ